MNRATTITMCSHHALSQQYASAGRGLTEATIFPRPCGECDVCIVKERARTLKELPPVNLLALCAERVVS